MAESKLITSIGEELECPVCADYYTDARFLSCMHAFCKTCLEKCDKTLCRGGKSVMNCPLCRKQTYIGKEGAAGLPIDFTSNKLVTRLKDGIEERRKAAGSSPSGSFTCQSCQEGVITAYCLSCCHFICASCQSLHTKLGAMRTHEVVPMKDLRKGNVTLTRKTERNTVQRSCSVHHMEIAWFCSTCSSNLCELCYMLEHGDHECCEVNSQIVNKENVQKVIGKLSSKMISLALQKSKVKRLRAGVKRHFGSVKDKLKSTHELRLKTITRIMGEKLEELVKELADDEELVLAKVASIDESLGHAESRAVEARAIGNNAVNDGEHAEMAFIDGYLESVVSSLYEDTTAEKTLDQIQRFAVGVKLSGNETENIESLASLGQIFRPEVWDTVAKHTLPLWSSGLRSIKYDPATKSFLLAYTNAMYSIDARTASGPVKHVREFPSGHVILDMAIAPDGSSYYLYCEDNSVRVYDRPTFDTVPGVYDPPSEIATTMSCMAVDAKSAIVVGNQVTGTITWTTGDCFDEITGILPLQMAFTGRGGLAVVCQRCSGDDRNQGGVAVRVFRPEDRREGILVQDKLYAATVTTKPGNNPGSNRFYALGVHLGDDGRQLVSLAEYDTRGEKKESICEDIHLPVNMNGEVKPLIAVDNEGRTIAVFTGRQEVHILQKRKFSAT